MSVIDYLQNHGTPMLEITWGYRKLRQTGTPIILIECFVNEPKGYGRFVCQTIQNSNIELEWALYDDAWYLEAVIDGETMETPIAVYPFDTRNDFALRYEYKLAREIRTMWCLGYKALVHFRELRHPDTKGVLFSTYETKVVDGLSVFRLWSKLYEEPQPRLLDLPRKIRRAVEKGLDQPWGLVDVQLLDDHAAESVDVAAATSNQGCPADGV